MAYPMLADLIVVQHYWWDERTRQGVNGSVKFTPLVSTSSAATPLLTDASEKAWIKTREWVASPDFTSGYLAVPLTPNDDQDLTAFAGYRVSPAGEDPRVVEVTSTAGTTTVDVKMQTALAKLSPPISVTLGQTVKTVWLTDVAEVDNPPTPPESFFNAAQTTAAIAAGILAHDDDPDAHSDIRALIAGGGGGSATPDATTSVKGKARLLGGTADNPTVPYSAVTGAPTSLPPSGGAGGVLGGTFPNPSFAVDMATQAELDAAAAAVPEQARDAVGAALVQGSNITITVDDTANTITISAAGGGSSYTDEQVQDVVAALLAAGTQSGITFTYNDTGNAISATVSAQTWTQVSGKPTFSTVATSGSASDITTGTLPDSVIPSGIARDSEVTAAIQAVVGTAPANLDTLQEIATQLANDESAASALTTTVAGKLAKTSNLSDVASASTARTNLGLGTLATTTPTGTASSTTYLRGDGVWGTPAGSGGSVADQRSIGIYRPENYGAVGNGSTNDSSAFQAMLDDLPITGATVVLAAKRYLIPSGGLTHAYPLRIVGVPGLYENEGSQLVVTANGVTGLTLTGRSNALEDVTVAGPTGTALTTASVGVSITGTMTQARNLITYGFSTGLKIAGSYWVLDGCISRLWYRYGIEVYSTNSDGDDGDSTIINSTIDKSSEATWNGGTAVSWIGGGGLRFVNNKLIGDTTHKLANGLLYTPTTNVVTGVVFVEGNSIEHFTGSGVGVVNGAGSINNSLIITGNEIAAYERTASTAISVDEAISGVVIVGNHLYYATNGVDVAHIASAVISGNSLSEITGTGIKVRSTATSVFVDPHQPINMVSGTAVTIDDSGQAAAQGQLYTAAEKTKLAGLSSGGAVSSVAGRTGAVTLSKTDVGLGNVDNVADTAKPVSTATQTALDAKAPTVRALTAGTGLTGGGDLTADRSFAVAYGTGAGTAAQGNDSRLSDTRTPTDASVTDAKVSSSAGIAESKLSLASDAAAGTASRRTLGTGAAQAAAGNHTHTAASVGAAPLLEGVNTVATAGTSQTLPDTATATVHDLTLTASGCALTFPTAAAGKSFTLVLRQDSTGGRAVTWPTGTKWAGGIVPTLSTPAAAVDSFSLLCVDGTNWLGYLAGKGMA